MQIVIEIDSSIYDICKSVRNLPLDENDIMSSLIMQSIANGTPLNEYIAEYIDKAFDELNRCQCGSSYIIINGEEYRTDIGYAFEGIELFMNYIKGTLSKEKWEE